MSQENVEIVCELPEAFQHRQPSEHSTSITRNRMGLLGPRRALPVRPPIPNDWLLADRIKVRVRDPHIPVGVNGHMKTPLMIRSGTCPCPTQRRMETGVYSPAATSFMLIC